MAVYLHEYDRGERSDREASRKRASDVTPFRRATRGVLVAFESSADGRAALFQALDIARRAGLPLTVVSVATKEPVNVGCARCRQSAAIWNVEMREVAEENLAEAADLLGSSPAIDYVVIEGRRAQAIGEAAHRAGADLIVLPWEPSGRVRRLFSAQIAEEVRRAGSWQVIVAPAATPRSRLDPSIAQTMAESEPARTRGLF